jgi:hypothetical protein
MALSKDECWRKEKRREFNFAVCNEVTLLHASTGSNICNIDSVVTNVVISFMMIDNTCCLREEGLALWAFRKQSAKHRCRAQYRSISGTISIFSSSVILHDNVDYLNDDDLYRNRCDCCNERTMHVRPLSFGVIDRFESDRQR